MSSETSLLMINSCINKYTLTETHNIAALTGLQCFLCYIIYLVQLNVSQHPAQKWHSLSSEVTLSRGRRRVWHHILLWKKTHSSSQQTVVTVCHSVTSQPACLSGEIYRSTLTAWDTNVSMMIVSPLAHDERLLHTYGRRWKIIPRIAVSAVTSLSLSAFDNSDWSYFCICSCCSVQICFLGPCVPMRAATSDYFH